MGFYLHALLWNWFGILLAVDGVVALLDRLFGESVERWLHRKPRIPAWSKIAFAVAVLFVAQYRVYQTVQEDSATLRDDNAALRSALGSLQAQQPKPLPPEQPEAPNSLRRRVKGLANDTEAFLKEEQEKQRQFIQTHGGGDALREYYIESQARFVSRGLQDRTVQIAHELEAKGLPIGSLQYASQNGYIGIDLEHLRDLAYRLDKDGNVINF
jgi:hypothetical protein